MTALFAIAAVLAANYVYTRWEGGHQENVRRLADFNRLEGKHYCNADTAWPRRI